MVNVIIYLKKQHDAKELVSYLLTEKLIASASIDENNVSYKIAEGVMIEEIFNVITSQTKALLFNDIVDAVETKVGEKVAINSIPIVGASGFFNDTVRTRTIPI